MKLFIAYQKQPDGTSRYVLYPERECASARICPLRFEAGLAEILETARDIHNDAVVASVNIFMLSRSTMPPMGHA